MWSQTIADQRLQNVRRSFAMIWKHIFEIVGDPDRRRWVFSFLRFFWSLAIVKSYGDQSSAIELYLIILRIQSHDSTLVCLQGVNWPASMTLFRRDGARSDYRHLVTSFERKMFTTRAKNNSLLVPPKILKKYSKKDYGKKVIYSRGGIWKMTNRVLLIYFNGSPPSTLHGMTT